MRTEHQSLAAAAEVAVVVVAVVGVVVVASVFPPFIILFTNVIFSVMTIIDAIVIIFLHELVSRMFYTTIYVSLYSYFITSHFYLMFILL